jgi:hypothetical protein
MRKMLICSVVAMAILWASSIGFTKEKGQTKNKSQARQQKKQMTEEQKQWRQKLRAMTPEERKLAMAKKDFEMNIAPWHAVLKIANEEKATKTIAAITKIIADKEQLLKKKLAAVEKKKAASKAQTKPKDKTKTDRKRAGKKKPEAQK